MSTLLLRLAAPMQAWGDESKYDIRATRKEPTKSGIIGMVAASLGYSRDSEDVKKLACMLRMGVRVDQPGTVIRDYHTALAPKYSSNGSLRYAEDGSVIMDNTYVTERYYLSDAAFLVGLECDDKDFLNSIAEALAVPVFPVFLGRKSCLPSLPIYYGIRETNLENALKEEKWIASDWFKKKQKTISAKLIIECKNGQVASTTRMDQPISFNPIHRRYSLRGLDRPRYVQLGTVEHDPVADL